MKHTPTAERLRRGIHEADCSGCGAEIVDAAYGDVVGWLDWDTKSDQCPGPTERVSEPTAPTYRPTETVPAADVAVGETVIGSTDYLVADVREVGGQVLLTDSHGTVYAMGPDHLVTVERVSEPHRVTGGKAHRTERVRTDELAAGDVIEYDSGARSVVLSTRTVESGTTAGWRVLRLSTDTGECEATWSARSMWDRLSEDAKREAGYPTAEHDVPSEREERPSELTPRTPTEAAWTDLAEDEPVTVLARHIHAVVFESDLRGGHLSPIMAARTLRAMFPRMSDERVTDALNRATASRGRRFR